MKIDAPSGVVGVWDSASYAPPAGEPARGLVAELKRAAEGRNVFFIDAEDPVAYNVEVFVDQEVPPGVAQTCEVRAGSFGLRVPSGRLLLGSIPTSPDAAELTLPAGDYLVTPMARRHFDVQWHDPLMRQLLGESDWRYYKSVMKLGALGGLGWILFAILMAIPATRGLWPIAAPLLILPWLVYFLLIKLPRYRGVQEKQRLHESELPHFALILKKSAAATEVPGGWTPGL